MGKWLDGIKDTLEGAGSFSLDWLKSALVLFIILLLIWAIVETYDVLF